MVYDAKTSHMILFGGVTALDSGTSKAYYLADTWEWTGFRWIQRYPAQSPNPRAGHAMVYDSTRDRIVLFGGRGPNSDTNDTWAYSNDEWAQIDTPNAPSARILPGAAYDSVRDRIVLYGGSSVSADGKTVAPLHDTWEFDGTTWTQIGGDGPAISKPLLEYDPVTNQVIMLGLDDTVTTQMYSFDPASGSWTHVTPAALPPCVNEGAMTWDPADQVVLYTGGVCSTSSGADESYEWDGTTWNKVTVILTANRLFGAGLAYDAARKNGVMFGGTGVDSVVNADTWIFSGSNWTTYNDSSRPDPRSLFAFTTDPVHQTIWMFGGTDGLIAHTDLWQYQNGVWQSVPTADGPASCLTPLGAWDSNRNTMVVSCGEGTTYEWDGTTWKTFTSLKTTPPFHEFANMVYDPALKKTVLFGGYDGANYLDQTWLWDGTSWTRQSRNPAPARTLEAMWYDPTLQKVVIYGGIGRITSQDRITRFDDMWTFDGSGWTELKPASGTPGERYGAQVYADPATNHVLLFGGMRVDTQPPVPPATVPTDVQVYADDMWQWDGSAWTKLDAASVPQARENGRIAYDITRNEIVLFAGYAGHYFSDLWVWDGNGWQLRVTEPLGNRRRVGGR